MQIVKQVLKKIPVIPRLYRFLKYYELNTKSVEHIFTDIYNKDKFGGKDSASGPGSDLYQTKLIIKELPRLFKELNISTILDIPCGDFHWMNCVDLSGVEYSGADIVKELIQHNREKYERRNIKFQHLNIIDDRLPRVDIILCRDCLVHFSFKDIFLALDNIVSSKSEYFLTTTFPLRKDNHDILTGQWRTLNLEVSPFNFPPPLRIINESCSEVGIDYIDKSLGLWRIEDIEKKPNRAAGSG